MAWYESTPLPLYKKTYTHNLGHKPIVFARINLESIGEGAGYKEIPCIYSKAVFDEGTGWTYYVGHINYSHQDNNTVVFEAPENAEIVADIFIDPQYNAWYE
jgi:hypothetical protein